MISLLLTIHIVTLIISVIATTAMMVTVLLSRSAPKLARKITLLITGVGIALGTILLIQHPLGSRCIELLSYVIIFSVAYRYIELRSKRLSTVASS